MTLKVKHIHVKSPDPRKTAAWWAENLGAKIVSEKSNPIRIKLDFGGIPFIVSEIYEKQHRDQSHGLEHMDIATTDAEFDSVLAKLKANGARILSDQSKPGKKLVFFETAEGVQLALSTPEKVARVQ